jgi:hypothetical protein
MSSPSTASAAPSLPAVQQHPVLISLSETARKLGVARCTLYLWQRYAWWPKPVVQRANVCRYNWQEVLAAVKVQRPELFKRYEMLGAGEGFLQ